MFKEAVDREIMLFPVSNVQDAMSDPHLLDRGFWAEIEHGKPGETLSYPGPFAKFSETPLRAPDRAPRIGEHNQQVYVRELGLTSGQMKAYMKQGII